MDTFMDLVSIEAENVTEERLNRVPFAPFEEQDEVIGEIPEDLRRLYVLSVEWARTAAEEEIAVKFSPLSEKQLHEDRCFEHQQKSCTVSQIMWVTLRSRLEIWNVPDLAIRDGWKIVSRKGHGHGAVLDELNLFGA